MEGNGGHSGAAVEPRRVASIRIARESVDRARARSAAHKLDSQHGSVQNSQRIPWELAGSQVSPHGQGGEARRHAVMGRQAHAGGGDKGQCSWRPSTPIGSVPHPRCHPRGVGQRSTLKSAHDPWEEYVGQCRSRAQGQACADERGVSEAGTALRSPGRRRGVQFS
jgi:hypothetical protein